MTKVATLTEEQEVQLEAFRERMLRAAVSTTTQVVKAERAIMTILGPTPISGVKVWWLPSSMKDNDISGRERWSNPFRNHLRDALSNAIEDTLWTKIRKTLREPIQAALSGVQNPILASFWDIPRDLAWVAFYAFPSEAGLVEYPQDLRARIEAYVALSESAFAIWLHSNDHVNVLRKPTLTTLNGDEMVTNFYWEDK
jgi:hypothetical protein